MRSSHTNVNKAPGGCPETWVIHEFGWKSRILLAKVRTASGMSVIVGTWRRYSCRAVSRPAKPRCQPSTIASENAQPHVVAQVTHGTARHGSHRATVPPHSTAATPMTIAGRVPQPTCAFHQPKIGAVCAKARIRAGVLLISGVTMPRSRWGTTKAAATSTTASATATTSRRTDLTSTNTRGAT